MQRIKLTKSEKDIQLQMMQRDGVKINEGEIFSKRNSNTIAQELQSIKEHKEKGSVVQPLSASEEVGGITTEPKSVYKVKDLIHNTQENDKELLGIKGMTPKQFFLPLDRRV